MALLKILIQITNKLFQLIYNLTRFNLRLLDGFLQRQGCHTGDAAGRDAQTVIGIGAGQTQHTLDRVKPVHHLGRVLLVIILNPPTRGESTDVLEGCLLGAKKIAIQRKDRLCLGELIGRLDRCTKSNRGRLSMDAEVHRLVLVKVDPLGL